MMEDYSYQQQWKQSNYTRQAVSCDGRLHLSAAIEGIIKYTCQSVSCDGRLQLSAAMEAVMQVYLHVRLSPVTED